MPESIQLMSFNVCGLPSRMRPIAERAPEFCRRIEASGVDVVNFQEVWTRRILDLIRTHLPSYQVAWHRGMGGQPTGGLATFSRQPLGAVAYTSYRRAFPPAGSLRFRIKRTVNTFLQGVLTVDLAGHDVVLANTHLTANKDGDWSAGNRYHPFQAAQLRRLHEVLRPARARSALTIVTGDFNIASTGPLYPSIVDHGAWLDPFADTDPPTFHAEFLPPGFPGERIDYILASTDDAIVHTGLEFTGPIGDDPWYLSDHVALTARVALPVG